ncbi:YhgE/Pip domain-containing protein [Leuconostoc falkenbergense]|uniref:YhgE/Pip domain-containing protein n=1 Tax=Leuconostoc falkenbergense TaxID=2766470 RepID=UPI0024A9CA59|nr:YhgE/Pip domain-containing protein [Leuconostoc falkenbergense]MDI6552217.1 YhgE/Pip domain-containing protein [Leuconostoc falkenbergense]
MKFWKSTEWQRVRKIRGLPLLLIGIALIPSLYAVIFLSSLWDAYGNVNKLPVAIVNQDRAAKINGKTQHLGNNLTKNLVDGKQLKIIKTTKSQAASGLKSGKYYMTITIPSDFTENSGTLLSSNPVQPEIKIAHNTGQGFIAEKMTTSAAEKLQTKVSQSLQKVYSQTLVTATTASKDGFNTGSEGASQLSSGISQLQDGTKQLQTGTTTLQSGSAQLVTGLSQYTSGVSSANSGSAQLVAGAQQLATQLQKVSDEINAKQQAKASDLAKLDAGLTELTQQLEKLRSADVPTFDLTAINNDSKNLNSNLTKSVTDATSAGQSLNDLAETHPELFKQYPDLKTTLQNMNDLQGNLKNTVSSATSLKKDSEQLQSSILSQINTLKSSLNDLSLQGSGAVEQAQQAIKTLNASLTEVSNGIATQAVPGAQQLAQGASQLNAGLSQLNANSGTLNQGASQLNSGTSQLLEGENQAIVALGQANTGAQTLSQKLADGAVKLSSIHNQKSNVTALSKPVKKDNSDLSKVANNGTGMAPYMMSVGLFVGMVAFSAIFDFMTVGKKPKNGFLWWADKQTVNAPVWIAQALLMTALLFIVDGMQTQKPVMTFIVALVASFAFNQFVILFNVAFGKLGSGIMLILMVLQLSASAGTYPIELSNGFFNAIHPWMPMTYSVHALRETISIGGSVALDLTVLLSLGIVSMILTWGVYEVKLRHNQLSFPQSSTAE